MRATRIDACLYSRYTWASGAYLWRFARLTWRARAAVIPFERAAHLRPWLNQNGADAVDRSRLRVSSMLNISWRGSGSHAFLAGNDAGSQTTYRKREMPYEMQEMRMWSYGVRWGAALAGDARP